MSARGEYFEPVESTSRPGMRKKLLFGGVAAVAGFVLIMTLSWGASIEPRDTLQNVRASGQKEEFDEKDRYVVKNYDLGPPFTSFLPGVGGKFGIPMWAFYVNKGQALTSFGLKTKDTPLMEFTTANLAYQKTMTGGFRTFIKGSRAGKSFVHQPFFQLTANDPPRDMHVGMNELMLEERAADVGLTTQVEYFMVSNEEFPGLLRRTTIKNTGKDAVTVEVLDGITKIQPFGVTDLALKQMGRTLESWYLADNMHNKPSQPFFRLSSSFGDTEVVTPITEGTFALAYLESDAESEELLPILIDPAKVFGHVDSALVEPFGFMEAKSIEELFDKQATVSRTACAYSAAKLSLKPGQSATLVSMYGHANSTAYLSNVIAPIFASKGFVPSKQKAAENLANTLTLPCATKSGSALFDNYARYNLLDNLLRGGVPYLVGNPEDPKVYHTFSRIHGDPERDYNWFVVEPTYFSQGPGNYRDVNQNRRSDVLLEPGVGDFNIKTFWSLVQADGYNPLSVLSAVFVMNWDQMDRVASSVVAPHDKDLMKGLLQGAIVPGNLFKEITNRGVQLTVSREEFLNTVVGACNQYVDADYKQGYWSDHWTYNLDQIKSYQAIYPDKMEHLLFDSAPLPFFYSPATVASRSSTNVLLNGKPRQLHAVYPDWEKQNFINSNGGTRWQFSRNGGIFQVPLATKVVMLAVIKFSMMDPAGMGISMDGGRPGWLDAMNGLPGLFGSGMPETFELLHMLDFISENIIPLNRPIGLPKECADLAAAVWDNLAQFNTHKDDWAYWNSVMTARENYRAAVRVTFEGTIIPWGAQDVGRFVDAMRTKINAGIEKASAMNNGIPPTYFSYEPVEWDVLWPKTDGAGNPNIFVKKFKTNMLPLFLEGPVRALKVMKDKASRKALYTKVKASALYDSPLSQYKISESLKDQPLDIGRCKAFPAGWLENESIWLHMSYKYYLELLRGGLFEEFWAEVKNGVVAFMDIKTYGRNPMEASSFIASSAHEDQGIHGTGFVSRLSGSTAEFLSMWLTMMEGQTPFTVKEGALQLALKPALPSWLFDENGAVSFNFLSSTLVTYHNPAKANTWGLSIEKIEVKPRQGEAVTIKGGVIAADLAKQVRTHQVASIDVYFASA